MQNSTPNTPPNSKPLPLLRSSAVKAFCRQRDRRVSAGFMASLDYMLRRKLALACAVHNGGKKTLDPAVAAYVGIPVGFNPSQPS